MEQRNELSQAVAELKNQINQLRQLITTVAERPKELRREWIPRDEVMSYLGYADTQMTAIARRYKIATTQIGKRIFYGTASLVNVLNDNQK